jgi:disulfide bond formation protein DsbB
MRVLSGYVLRHWLTLALLASAGMLAIAHGFETFGHLAPCTLCYYQRDVYWTAAPIAAAGLVLTRTPLKGLAPLVGWLLALTFLAGLGIAVWHAGAEWKFWPGPKACSGGGGAASVAGLAALLKGAKVEAPHCDEAAWRFLGLSMAGWNALISLKLAAWSAAWSVWSLSNGRTRKA